MKQMRLWGWVFAAIWLAVTARAWQPAGWTYWDWPWAYDSASGDWYWFSPGDSQWIFAHPPGNGWAQLPQSGIARGWSYWSGEWAYDGDNGAWCWRNAGDTQWCVNMRTEQWSVLAQAAAGGLYLVIDLSGGPSAPSYPVSNLSAVPAGGWTDEYKTTRLVLRRIPAGTFNMGSPAGELERDSDETLHRVTLTKDFYIGVFEVTQRQWELVMGGNRSYFNNATYYQTRPVEQVSYCDIREDPSNNTDDPAVDWPANGAVNANSFMGILRAKTGLAGFDLPTESQWEYACRAGTATALNSGYNLAGADQDARMNEAGRYFYNGGSSFSRDCAPSGGTALAGSYLANAWGLYDMHGNVWEWCLDWWGFYPGTANDPPGASSGSHRALRGGSWGESANFCRSAYRYNGLPAYRFIYIGFRACCAPPGQP